tara:strand:+ start:195665 stop:196360 length:696 start_codon:yes stop_codon:yes gene_type:complete
MNIILLGAPGAGKGTQAQKIQQKFNIPQLSTGDMLRHEIHNKTEAGKQAAKLIDDGNFVPDALILQMIESRILQNDCANGFILDGFPRNLAQCHSLKALFLKHGLAAPCVIHLKVSDSTLAHRLSGRLYAEQSKCVYHISYNPPLIEGICDVSGEKLVQRKDDKADVIQHRLKIYHAETAPVFEYYKTQGRVFELGAASIHAVFTQICTVCEIIQGINNPQEKTFKKTLKI